MHGGKHSSSGLGFDERCRQAGSPLNFRIKRKSLANHQLARTGRVHGLLLRMRMLRGAVGACMRVVIARPSFVLSRETRSLSHYGCTAGVLCRTLSSPTSTLYQRRSFQIYVNAVVWCY